MFCEFEIKGCFLFKNVSERNFRNIFFNTFIADQRNKVDMKVTLTIIHYNFIATDILAN